MTCPGNDIVSLRCSLYLFEGEHFSRDHLAGCSKIREGFWGTVYWAGKIKFLFSVRDTDIP